MKLYFFKHLKPFNSLFPKVLFGLYRSCLKIHGFIEEKTPENSNKISMRALPGIETNRPLKSKAGFWISLLFFITACQDPPARLFHTESLVLNNKTSDNQIQHFQSTHNLSGINSKEYYEIKALFPQDSGFLELLSHSKDSYLGDGVSVRVERDENDLTVKLKVSGFPYEMLLMKADYFLNQSEIDWTVEVHNGIYEGFRVQIWENFLNIKNILKQKTQNLTPRNLIADSFSKDLTFFEKGYGLTWGVKIHSAKLLSAKRIFNKKI